MSHTRAMSLCWLCPCCKMWRGQAKYKCVLDFKKHEIDGAERKAGEHTVAGPMAPSVMDGCQPLQCHPISWGHTTGGHVSLEVSHQNSQPHDGKSSDTSLKLINCRIEPKQQNVNVALNGCQDKQCLRGFFQDFFLKIYNID